MDASLNKRITHKHRNVCGSWWVIGRFDTLRPKGRGFESRSDRHVSTPVALRRETPTQHSSCVGRVSVGSGGLEEAL